MKFLIHWFLWLIAMICIIIICISIAIGMVWLAKNTIGLPLMVIFIFVALCGWLASVTYRN
jgi:type III secretory pathway component EscR